MGPTGFFIVDASTGHNYWASCISYYFYADDSQLHLLIKPTDLSMLYSLQDCLLDVKYWMTKTQCRRNRFVFWPSTYNRNVSTKIWILSSNAVIYFSLVFFSLLKHFVLLFSNCCLLYKYSYILLLLYGLSTLYMLQYVVCVEAILFVAIDVHAYMCLCMYTCTHTLIQRWVMFKCVCLCCKLIQQTRKTLCCGRHESESVL